MNRRKERRRSNSLGGRREEDSIFTKDKSESVASLAILGIFVVLMVGVLLVRQASS